MLDLDGIDNIASRSLAAISHCEAAAKYPVLHDVARIMIAMGLRPAEVVGLEVDDVDLDKGTVRIQRSKTAAGRRVLAVPPALRPLLERRIQSAISGRLFTGERGGVGSLLNTLADTHQRVLKLTGLAFVLYELRHTFASRLSASGCSLPTLARILGHVGLSSIGRYVHPSQQEMDEAILKYSERARFGFGAVSEPVNPGQSGVTEHRPVRAGQTINREKQLG
jgi:integrase